MREPRMVMIDGERYLPARMINVSLREAAARAIAAAYWGSLGDGDWEAEWNKHMDGVRIIVTDHSNSGISAHEFLDKVCARLVGVPS